ncbi:hypothetical protein KNP414_04024 [Paenibacillus mucilaginosus KNP414]|uniref:Uncharacterized protein n=1 Tax=Paenibacillus mucilaginosus (strain KNP414) TaxID=1036673 RepID=F8FBJ0_PAEMK|nr:hypothetical protein KNP414_04024 [Paenibacillus mucilaginosus KNP414]
MWQSCGHGYDHAPLVFFVVVLPAYARDQGSFDSVRRWFRGKRR